MHGVSHHQHQDVEREYYELMKRKGITLAMAREEMRTRTTLIAAMHVRRGYADAMLCGVRGTYDEHLRYVRDAIGPHDRQFDARRHEHADAAGSAALHLRHLRQPRSRASPRSWR